MCQSDTEAIMKIFISVILFTYLLRSSHQEETQGANRRYRAAVMEYHPVSNTDENIRNYQSLIKKAASGSADIIAFPEGTLTVKFASLCMVPSPEDKIIPYKNETYAKYKALAAISESAAENKIYVVVNLRERQDCVNGSKDCPDRGYFVYNTNVAFDRNGMVIARYRKFNLYGENLTDKPKTAELSTFATDFGVNFGMFICFDILFKAPAIDLVRKKGVTNLIFSSFWFGEMPFLTAAQIQAGWSYSMNATLLASGANNPRIGSAGTGIYIGRKERVTYMMEETGGVMIIRPIGDKSSSSIDVKARSANGGGLVLKQDPSIPKSSGKDLDFNSGTFQEVITHNGFNCRFSAVYRKSNETNKYNYTYRAVAFNGKRNYDSGLYDVNYCAILLCTNGDCAKKPGDGEYPLIFDSITVEGTFIDENTLQIPSTLVWQGNVLNTYLNTMDYNKFSYETNKYKGVSNLINVSIRLVEKGIGNLITFGIYGREFDKVPSF